MSGKEASENIIGTYDLQDSEEHNQIQLDLQESSTSMFALEFANLVLLLNEVASETTDSTT